MTGNGAPGIERMEVRLQRTAFSPHRHDTYAIGLTLAGVQRFRFRGSTWNCLPGQCHILHPDELHDGRAATDAGFAYRMVHIDPALLTPLTSGLPFVAQPVVDLNRFALPADRHIWHQEDELDSLAQLDLIETVARWLTQLGGEPSPQPSALAAKALQDVRDRIAQDPAARPAMAELERLSGLDRWTLARQFRAAFGTSPSRFRTCRQLARAQQLLSQGMPIAQAAADAGFADQSHFSRHFKRAYGITPGRWTSMLPGQALHTG
ncbi:MAG: AraC family transcriptional regulator [Burkholderiaceae bacterium]